MMIIPFPVFRNASAYMGVVRVPQRAGLLPRLMRSRRDLAVFNKWVRKIPSVEQRTRTSNSIFSIMGHVRHTDAVV